MGNRVKLSVTVLLLMLIVMLFVNSGLAKKERTFAVIYPVINPFFDGTTNGAEAAAKRIGCKLLIKGPDKFDVQQQIQIVEELINIKVEGIAIGPTDGKALAPVINKAIKNGIKVVCFDTDCLSSNRISFIGTDNFNAGKHMGEVVAKLLNNKGNIICSQGIPSQLNLQQRLQGVKEVLKQYPNMHIVDIESGQGDPLKTLSNIESMVKSYPNFDVLIGMDSFAGPQAVIAWKENGLKKPIVTFDDLPETLQGIRDGQITVAIIQKQYQWGTLTIKRLNEACDGMKIPINEDTGTIEVTKANVDTLSIH